MQPSAVNPSPIAGSNVTNNSNAKGTVPHSDVNHSNIQQSNIKRNDTGSNNLQPNAQSRIDNTQHQSAVTDKKQQSGPDWNLIFLQNPTEKTLHAFQKSAHEALLAIWKSDCSALQEANRVY